MTIQENLNRLHRGPTRYERTATLLAMATGVALAMAPTFLIMGRVS